MILELFFYFMILDETLSSSFVFQTVANTFLPIVNLSGVFCLDNSDHFICSKNCCRKRRGGQVLQKHLNTSWNILKMFPENFREHCTKNGVFFEGFL